MQNVSKKEVLFIKPKNNNYFFIPCKFQKHHFTLKNLPNKIIWLLKLMLACIVTLFLFVTLT